MELTEQEIVRRKKLDLLRANGINPYPADLFKVNNNSKNIKENFIENESVIIAGRIMSFRDKGKAIFIELQDSEGKIQIYISRDNIEDKLLFENVIKTLTDIGDIIGVEGVCFFTKTGNQCIRVNKFTFLSKSLKVLPQPKTDTDGKTFDAFTDVESRHRMRYVDLIVNKDVKQTFIKRANLYSAMRNYFNNAGYIEVETPILQSVAGGANARPFSTHHNALDMDLYLRIANELYLKRLIVGGFDGVYEFSKNFRNEGIDRTHNPEFTAMEIYIAYKDYYWMMEFTENLLEHCANTVNNTTLCNFGEHEINLQAPYKRITMRDAILQYTNFDISNKSKDEIFEAAKKMNINVDSSMGKGKLIDEIFSAKCEKNFIQPTFITDYPKEMSPLCKEHRDNSELSERFELIIGGKEIANSYSELNDPIEQRLRFEEQLRLSRNGDDEVIKSIDEDFLTALEYGMPPTGGLGIGIDRLIMLLTNNVSIQEVLLFPQMKSKN